MHLQPPAVRIRDLMPDGFLFTLIERTGCKQKQTISDVVRFEASGSRYWAAVLQLAEETDPEGFARWKAAQPQHATPAVTAAP
jgi:hypothetical protein